MLQLRLQLRLIFATVKVNVLERGGSGDGGGGWVEMIETIG